MYLVTFTVTCSFKAVDARGGVSVKDVAINLCNCSDNGECDFAKLRTPVKGVVSPYFKLALCDCEVGWTGMKTNVNPKI